MHKSIVLTDGIQEDYLNDVLNFITEWESYEAVLSLSTSGSTGPPKTMQFRREQAIASAKATAHFFDFKAGDSVLLNLSPRYVAGKLMIIRALEHKLNLIITPLSENPLQNLSVFPHPIKLAAFVPHQVKAILENPSSLELFKCIEHVLIGGAALSSDLEEKLAKLPNKIWMSFGMTETLTHFAMRQIDGKNQVYTCLPGTTISQDKRGCLIIHKNEILEQDLRSNDLIEWVDDKHFKWLGRFDNLINSGGVKIYPEHDEKIIETLLPDFRFYLSSKPHVQFGEEVVLVAEGKHFTDTEEKKLLHAISLLLPKYHAPKSIVSLAQFPTTHNGKIIRQKF